MKTLLDFSPQSLLFLLEMTGEENEKKYAQSIGLIPESVITVIKNPFLEHSSFPLVIEIHDTRFMIDQNLAKNITACNALEEQELIFKGNKTPQRKAILSILESFTDHFTLSELTKKVQESFPEMGEITIYRSLKILLEKDIIEEIDLPNERKKYEVKKGHHDHIFCQNCGNIIEFYSEEMEILQEKIIKENSATLLSHRVTLIASCCSKCR